MPSPIETILSTARKFSPGRDVTLASDSEFAAVAKRLSSTPRSNPPDHAHITEPDLLAELLVAATNYCFFTGVTDVQPAGGGCRIMGKIVCDSVKAADGNRQKAVELASEAVLLSRLPLAESRVHHMREIGGLPEHSYVDLCALLRGESDAETVLQRVIVSFPGFSNDPYLKRALLLFHLLHRFHGLYTREDIAVLPLPADYQVPRVLRHLGLLRYSPKLAERILDAEPIPGYSRIEHEIRANSIVAAARLAELSGLTVNEIDGVLWEMKDQVIEPHHLTVTTDY